ncbi:acyl-CoA synthetase, partial [Vibrio parahaemolyticus]|nr:acyl-CoA synthetase [Vibrio parahaemolyticus]
MKRLTTLASTIALIAAPSMALAGGYQWTNDTETIHGDVMD